MALEDIIRAGAKYHTSHSMALEYINDQGNLKTIPSNENLPDVVNALMPNTPEDVRNTVMGQMRNGQYGPLPGMINATKEEGKNQLVTTTSQNYGELIQRADANLLATMALQIPDANKRFYRIMSRLEDVAERGKDPRKMEDVQLAPEDFEAIRTDYASLFSDVAWRQWIGQQDQEYILKDAQRYVTYASNKFVKDNFSTQNGDAIDGARVRDYLTRTIGRYGNDNDRNKAYFTLGKTFSRAVLAQNQQRQEAH